MENYHELLKDAINNETVKFEEICLWLVQSLPPLFFEELSEEHLMLIIHNLMGFDAREYSATIHLKNIAISMSLDLPDADLRVLQNHATRGIRQYQVFVSSTPPPFLGVSEKLRIALICFTEDSQLPVPTLSIEQQNALCTELKVYNHTITRSTFDNILPHISGRFLLSLPQDMRAQALAMFYRATTRDQCQYEVRYNEEWQTNHRGSLSIVLGWRNTPKHNFLYRLVRIIRRHGLIIKDIHSYCTDYYSTDSVLLVAFELHGANNTPAWQNTNVFEFIKELITVKYFASFDTIDHQLVSKGAVSGLMGNLLRSMVNFIHQALVHVDVNLYNINNIEEGLCRHPELTTMLCEAFKLKFSPEFCDPAAYNTMRDTFQLAVDKLDTGHEENDIRRRNILRQGMNFVHYTLKTNFYRPNYTALCFRLDPRYLDEIPFERVKKFPELPYGIFFIKGMHFIGFHIRFRDLARGGLRTVFPEHTERMVLERNTVFTECYNLALTQQMKNKDIPEGGAKAIILLMPNERLESEASFLRKELETMHIPQEEADKRIEQFRSHQRLEQLYQAQRAFIENLIMVINCDAQGKLRSKDIIDYLNRPEYLYLGPDENMHDSMIQWIAAYSKKQGYKSGSAFISGKPLVGINHKEYGVTSLGVNVYLDKILKYLNIDPTTTPFTLKMAGGPDGDVAGNEICNLQKYYPKTAKLIALTDVTGTIYEPRGLDLEVLVEFFRTAKGIRHYPPQKLSEGGFLVDKQTKRFQTPLVQQTLCWRRVKGQLQEDWLSGSDMNHLLRHNVHRTYADVFIPAGGRPRTLNESNITDYLDDTGRPTSRAIIEGANLYLTPGARRFLEEKDVLIVKDSSANKTGVICSSFEVLSGLTLGDERFVEFKETLVKQIRERLEKCAANEAQLLLRTRDETGEYFTAISDQISKRINLFTDQLLEYLDRYPLSDDVNDPFVKCYLNYCLPILKTKFRANLIHDVPAPHKKAIIACYLAAGLVYEKGLNWSPSVVEILPVLLEAEAKK